MVLLLCLVVFSFSNNLHSLQILSYIGTYSLNLLSITIFLLPIIIFFNYKNLIKIFVLSFGLILVLTNFLYGNLNIKNFEKIKHDNLNSVIRVISPNIPIERFLTSQDTEKGINELINLSNPNNSKNTIFIFPEGIITSIYFKDLKFFKSIFKESYNINHTVILGINISANGIINLKFTSNVKEFVTQ